MKKNLFQKKEKRLKVYPDKNLWKRFEFIAGCDEAGRGPLAGPVVAATVILPRDFYHPQINDSKKLNPAKRERLSAIIKEIAISFAFGIVEPQIIDKINILNATKLAMRKAILGLKTQPQIVLIDALKISDLPFPQIPIIKGDSKSISIAAASILAKVERDSIMFDYHHKFPQYQFDKHKGYPTALHRKCIKKYGLSPIHRQTFKLF